MQSAMLASRSAARAFRNPLSSSLLKAFQVIRAEKTLTVSSVQGNVALTVLVKESLDMERADKVLIA